MNKGGDILKDSLSRWLGISIFDNENVVSSQKTADSLFTNLEIKELMTLTHALASAGKTVEMPRLVVVGSQSSGKSSVLNSLIGFDLLPTGSQMTTRVPLNANLVPTNSTLSTANVEFGNYVASVWNPEATFLVDLPVPSAESLEAIRTFIETKTVEIAGNEKNISNIPINMIIKSPNTVPLSIVDTPGIVMHALKDQGQPEDIKDRILALLSGEIKQERTIIVAVMPAREDLEADPTMEIVKRIDPEGKRSIGILTKPDLMNTHVGEYLNPNGKISSSLRMQFGYYCVKNKGPNGAGHNISSLHNNVNAESTYFSSHPVYKQYPEKTGIQKLSKQLGKVLTGMVASTLPLVYSEIKARLDELEKIKKSFSCGPGTEKLFLSTKKGPETLLTMFSSLSTDFSNSFRDSLDSRKTGSDLARRLAVHLDTLKKECMKMNLFSNDSQKITDEYITGLLKNAEGLHMKCFASYGQILEHVMQDPTKRPIHRFTKPAMECVQNMKRELMDTWKYQPNVMVYGPTVAHFPQLGKVFEHCLFSLLEECETVTLIRINDIIEAEEQYIYTDHSEFHKKIANHTSCNSLENTKIVLTSYYETVQITMQNILAKLIMRFFIREASEKLQETLFALVPCFSSEPKKIMELFVQDPAMMEKQKAVCDECEALKQALLIIKGASASK